MDSVASIRSDLEKILDRIAKLEHSPESERVFVLIQEGSDYLEGSE